MLMHGRVISPGEAEGEALVSPEPIGFYGGIDYMTGIVIEKDHPLEGQNVQGKILVFPNAKGSTVGSYVVYALAKKETGPLAIINAQTEMIVATGAILGDVPTIDGIDINKIKTGDRLRVVAPLNDRVGTVEIL